MSKQNKKGTTMSKNTVITVLAILVGLLTMTLIVTDFRNGEKYKLTEKDICKTIVDGNGVTNIVVTTATISDGKTNTVETRSDDNPDKTQLLVKPAPKSRHFFLSAPLDNTRINRDVQRLVDEVISHLTSVDNGKVEISLEINMTAPDGVPQSVVRTVSENCNTLKFTKFGFEE